MPRVHNAGKEINTGAFIQGNTVHVYSKSNV